jgi:glycopeptide antibiotics resistance protein
MTGLIRDLVMLALGAVAGVIAMYFIAKNNPKLVATWYAELDKAGKMTVAIVADAKAAAQKV